MAELDAELLERARAGDRQALSDLLERHGPSLREQLVGAIPIRWQSLLSLEDVLQQTFTDAFLGIGSFEPRHASGLVGWLMTMARHNLVDAVRMLEAEKRGGGRRPLDAQARPPEESFVALYEWLGATSTTPSREVAGREARQALDSALASLPATYAKVVRGIDLEGRAADQMAAELGRSRGAVLMLRARAHRLLAETMGTASKFLSRST